jgi:MerR family transcriptional regulator, light-induced transcriptional regulator
VFRQALLSFTDGAYQEAGMRNLFGAEHEERHPLQVLSGIGKNKSFATVATAVVATLASRSQPLGKSLEKMISAAEVSAFTTLAVGSSDAVAKGFISNLLARGVPTEEIYLQLLAPAAQRLGEYWACDRLNFAEQTLAFCRLQQAFGDLANWDVPTICKPALGSIYLVAAPGCQHTLGVRILADMFRRRGWRVEGGVGRTAKEVVRDVSEQRFDIVGLSVGAERELPVVVELIKKCRRLSKNRAAAYLLGGAVTSDESVDFDQCGADSVSKDALGAIRLAGQLLDGARPLAERFA